MSRNSNSSLTILSSYNSKKMWERDWLNFILSKYSRNIEWTVDLANAEIPQKIIFIGGDEDRSNEFIQKIRHSGAFYGVIQLSDETLAADNGYLADEKCFFLARNYINPKSYNNEKCITFGLGYRSGFNAGNVKKKQSSKRNFIWNFIGTVHAGNRVFALKSFETLQPHFVHGTSNFNSADYLPIDQYADIIRDSVFTLCPMGHVNIDTFRIYEALEGGSIPVVLRSAPHLNAQPSYWHILFKGDTKFPFIIANSWTEARAIADKIINENQYDFLQDECHKFWTRWKDNWKNVIQDNVGNLAKFSPPRD